MRILKVLLGSLLVVAFLAGFQICIDSGGKESKAITSREPHHEAISKYNVCSTGSIKSSAQLHLPEAHRSFPLLLRPSVDDCSVARTSAYPTSNKSLAVCEKLFVAEVLNEEEEEWIAETNSPKDGDDDTEMLIKTMDCDWVKKEMDNNFFVSGEEKDFPLAFAINLNQYPRQVFRFLRVIYRPHNIYCMHYDAKASSVTKQVMFNVASCLGNVVISRKVEDVYWGWYTLEEAYFNCFSELMLARKNYLWKYVITLCGKEVPLRTNAEIVAMLKPLNGTSSVQMVGADGLDDGKFKWKWSLNKMTGWIAKKDEPFPPIPYGLKVYKSWAYVALSYQFVEHSLCSPVGRALREYMKDVKIPEENFYAMLFMQPETPGGYREEHKDNIFLVTTYIWLDGDHHGLRRKLYLALFPHTICAGKNVHNICMLAAKDLHRVSYRPGVPGQQSDSYLKSGKEPKVGSKDRGPLFHNRYLMKYDHVVMDCMEQELALRNGIEYANKCRHS